MGNSPDLDSIKLPPNTKEGTITALVYRLGTHNPKMTAADMHRIVSKKFPGTSLSTIYSIRAVHGFRQRGKHTPPNTKSAAPASDKPAPAAAPTASIAPGAAERMFRLSLARIGTDKAEKILQETLHREIV